MTPVSQEGAFLPYTQGRSNLSHTTFPTCCTTAQGVPSPERHPLPPELGILEQPTRADLEILQGHREGLWAGSCSKALGPATTQGLGQPPGQDPDALFHPPLIHTHQQHNSPSLLDKYTLHSSYRRRAETKLEMEYSRQENRKAKRNRWQNSRQLSPLSLRSHTEHDPKSRDTHYSPTQMWANARHQPHRSRRGLHCTSMTSLHIQREGGTGKQRVQMPPTAHKGPATETTKLSEGLQLRQQEQANRLAGWRRALCSVTSMAPSHPQRDSHIQGKAQLGKKRQLFPLGTTISLSRTSCCSKTPKMGQHSKHCNC